jgi:lipopolysaccharide/colanic/teichoic acid biosynthesis glycosyltransferase
MIRVLDLFFAIIGIILLLPVFIIIAILVKLNSKGPLFYKQIRVGYHNQDFSLYKFRTMFINADKAGLLTVGGRDPRITWVGYYLRKYKLDELPQLFNVFLGQMSLVGPRPEVRKYVNFYTVEQMRILEIKPGITDWASIMYSDENIILEKAIDPEQEYIHTILPHKIRFNQIYMEKYGMVEYFKIIFFTFKKII